MAVKAPTKGNLIASKHSRELAENGFELMDKKRNILIREIMAQIDRAKALQGRIGETFSRAYFSLKMATMSMGDCSRIAESVPVDDGLAMHYRSVMGVEIPTLAAKPASTDTLPYGFSDTTSSLDDAYIKFNELKDLVRELAETENTIYRLAYSIKKTQKRANALKNIVIPGLDADIARISGELEEKEREEFVRLKVIKARKNK